MRNLIEPPSFAALFAAHPPEGFVPLPHKDGLPLFSADFDLLTTLDGDVRRVLKKAPFFNALSRASTFRTCFAGTTITEYAPLPKDVSPRRLLSDFVREQGAGHALTVIKDLPVDSPFLDEEDNRRADELAAEAVRQGFVQVEGQALAYVPIDFDSLDGWLAALSSSRRKDVRRKLRSRSSLDVEVLPFGDPRFSNQAFLDELHAMYLAVYEQSEIHFDLLGKDFFAAVLACRDIEGTAVFYRRGDELAGYNLCLARDGLFIDKYIGFKYPSARECNLYFVSWAVNLELALRRSCRAYVAGWTDPEVKAALGAKFTFTRHLVWVKNPVLRRLLRPLRRFFESDGRVLARRA